MSNMILSRNQLNNTDIFQISLFMKCQQGETLPSTKNFAEKKCGKVFPNNFESTLTNLCELFANFSTWYIN